MNPIYPNLSQPKVETTHYPYAQPSAPIQTQMYSQPVYAQPGTVVITTQPEQLYSSERDWSTDMCGWTDNIGECCLAMFCPLCYQCKLVSLANEPCWSAIIGGMVPLRTKIRTQRKIKGSICEDYYSICCCTTCALVQMSVEMKNTNSLI